MEYEVHSQTISWEPSDEIGLYFDLREEIPLGYSVSDIEKIISVANNMPKENVIIASRNMCKRADAQLNHEHKDILPERCMVGVLNTKNVYSKLVEALSK